MDDLKEKLCMENCLVGRLEKSRMEWVGYVEINGEVRLPLMAHVDEAKAMKGEEGRRRCDTIAPGETPRKLMYKTRRADDS